MLSKLTAVTQAVTFNVSFKMLMSQLNKVQLLLSSILQKKGLEGNV